MSNALNQYTAVGGVSYDYDDNGNLTQDEKFQYAYDPENRLTGATKLAGTPDPLTAACDTTLSFTTGGAAEWFSQTTTYHDGGDAAQSGAIGDSEETWMQAEVEGAGTLTFYWKVSSGDSDYLGFYLDGQYQTSITGSSSWQEKTYEITGAGPHTLKWRYWKDESDSGGSDCGWVDNVQWTGATGDPNEWQTVSYTYDSSGRRIEKKVDGQTQVKFIYDGAHIIAEYDGSNSLLRKYVRGPCVDEPICLIEASGDYAGTHSKRPIAWPLLAPAKCPAITP